MAERSFADLLADCSQTALKLEFRDGYLPTDPGYLAWQAGDLGGAVEQYAEWTATARAAVARGVRMRRVRIVSEPVSEYIRFEHEVTPGVNLSAGEDIRWLPRPLTSDLALPGNDVWVFDGRFVQFCLFAGDGSYVGDQVTSDPAHVKLCLTAFEHAWDRAVPHQDYRPA